MKSPWVVGLVVLAVVRWVQGYEHSVGNKESASATQPLFVNLTLIQSAVEKGAVCLDGTPGAYYLHPGSGSGANSWLIELEGGGWCNNITSCLDRKQKCSGSSNCKDKQLQFTGILSNKPEENPDFYNWNRVRIRYCDGASFAGEGYDEANGLYFRGQRIYSTAVEELMSKGMSSANKVLLTGCSAGGLASILHCDEFRELFPKNTKVKCLADAGLFLDAIDITGGHTLRSFYEGVVTLQGAAKNLPTTCTAKMRASLCFFPENLLGNIQTPTFILNAAYDVWQIKESLAKVDPNGSWEECKSNYAKCNAEQINFLQGFRNEMINATRGFSKSRQNGIFINSCFAHCQSESQDTWHGDNSPSIENKDVAKSVGDWYFDRAEVKAIDCPYPCDQTCHNIVSRSRK